MDFTAEKRTSARTPIDETVDIYIIDQKSEDDSTPNSDTFTASVIDISPTGIGLTSNVSLNKGAIIGFKKGQVNWDLPAKGVVVWSYSHKSGYRAGIEFIL